MHLFILYKGEKKMTLIKCPECQKEISDQSKKCPDCGHRLKAMSAELKYRIMKIVIIAIVNIVIFSIIVAMFGDFTTSNDKLDGLLEDVKKSQDELKDIPRVIDETEELIRRVDEQIDKYQN